MDFFHKLITYRDAYCIKSCNSSVSQSSAQQWHGAREVQAVKYAFALLHNVALEIHCLHHFAFVTPPSVYCVRAWGWLTQNAVRIFNNVNIGTRTKNCPWKQIVGFIFFSNMKEPMPSWSSLIFVFSLECIFSIRWSYVMVFLKEGGLPICFWREISLKTCNFYDFKIKSCQFGI